MMVKFLLPILLMMSMSCETSYRIVDVTTNVNIYDGDSTGYVYVLKRTKFPKITQKFYSHERCNCVCINDTIELAKDGGNSLIIKKK